MHGARSHRGPAAARGAVLVAAGRVAAGPGRGELAGLAPKKRGRKPTPVNARDRKIAELERQLATMTGRAEWAEALVDAQKNLAALLGRPGTSARS